MANNLRTLREAHSLTQEALEKASGVDQGIISSLETGRTKLPSYANGLKLAKGLSDLTGKEIALQDIFPPSPSNGGGGQ